MSLRLALVVGAARRHPRTGASQQTLRPTCSVKFGRQLGGTAQDSLRNIITSEKADSGPSLSTRRRGGSRIPTIAAPSPSYRGWPEAGGRIDIKGSFTTVGASRQPQILAMSTESVRRQIPRMRSRRPRRTTISTATTSRTSPKQQPSSHPHFHEASHAFDCSCITLAFSLSSIILC